jgi:sugar lactone lactonase YvrE
MKVWGETAMQIETPEVKILIDTPLKVGEGPCWDDATGTLLFVDIQAPCLYRYDPTTAKLARFEMPSSIGSFGLCPDGRAVVALRSGVHLFDFSTGKLEFLVHPEPERTTNRLNDGKVGPDGAFWVGSMDDRPEKEPVAALYRVDATGGSVRVRDGLTVSNGLAWSPDGTRMFHTDSRQRFVQTYDFDAAVGTISGQQTIRLLEEDEGRPDGGACDAEGFYWSAGVSAGRLNRIAPDGRIDRVVALPVEAPTMPCFGGPDGKTLYVTSLASNRSGTPQSGTLLSFRIDVAGAKIARFGVPL